ncbi:IS3 family transposase [Enterococcus faecium]|uniref:IS3 family transposase n=1 Tax=Enterococcus faecium TaxID=1352 RepID=UPI000CFB09EB|nr:IS3 family transposase [Enterococcus faecium]MBJ0993790.1 IS3 family transposase [Enterococcus faecium]MBJ1007929.1 IS3 family transposase [Enterococcus faecium]MBJ1222405.1 IS3 family transposase [Enterococcus faecium]MDH2807585.1 IS3 family transposase [Enterococcus faecium]MDH2849287.1 IS3 family transposase [Enterococcus faecium]
MSRRQRRTYSKEFKQQIVDLYLAGKPRAEIIREYELTPSSFDKWMKQAQSTGSFKERDNLTPEQAELIALRKKNKQLEMENDILKQAALIFGPKRQVIDANKHKYSISAMCKILNISRQTYYYQAKPVEDESELEELVQEEFIRNRKAYGTRKLKQCLANLGLQVSQRRIGRMMKQRGLRSTYTLAHFKFHSSTCNEAKTANILDGTFLQEKSLEAIVTDLTYVRVGKKWQYICLILDLFNREIIGYSCGEKKDATLVKEAFAKIPYSLNNVQLFHTDRGKEFDNQTIDEILWAFNITRSLSKKGCPYDNAVAESTYKSVKVEFVHQYRFETLANLRLELFDYVHWWNTIRLHGTLGYETPISFRQQRLAQRILDNELGCDTGGEAP